MDTDDLTDMAWDVIVRAAHFSNTLKVELGAMSRQFQNENEWLLGVREHLGKFTEAPDEYVDFLSLEEEENISQNMLQEFVVVLSSRVGEVLAVPLDKRGRIEW